jgi:hypothetical protein
MDATYDGGRERGIMAGKEITDFSDNALSIIAFNSLCLYLLFSSIAYNIL